MRMRTIRGAHREIHAADPNSAIGLTTLYRMVADGAIPSVPIGKGKIMVDMDILEEYLSGKKFVEAAQ